MTASAPTDEEPANNAGAACVPIPLQPVAPLVIEY